MALIVNKKEINHMIKASRWAIAIFLFMSLLSMLVAYIPITMVLLALSIMMHSELRYWCGKYNLMYEKKVKNEFTRI